MSFVLALTLHDKKCNRVPLIRFYISTANMLGINMAAVWLRMRHSSQSPQRAIWLRSVRTMISLLLVLM